MTLTPAERCVLAQPQSRKDRPMPRRRQSMPVEFPLYAAREGNLKLRKRFGVGGVTIEIWRRQIGARYTPAQHVPKVVKRAVLRKAKRLQRMRDEMIEDLEDFDVGACVRSGGYGDW